MPVDGAVCDLLSSGVSLLVRLEKEPEGDKEKKEKFLWQKQGGEHLDNTTLCVDMFLILREQTCERQEESTE